MGTRAAYGFRLEGKDIMMYNHSDGYPTGLGEQVFEEFCECVDLYGWDGIIAKVKDMRKVKEDKEASVHDFSKYAQFWQQVDTGKNYYALLRSMQGHIKLMLEHQIMIPMKSWKKGDVEYGYVIDLDTKKMEVWTTHDKTRILANIDLANIDHAKTVLKLSGWEVIESFEEMDA